MSLTSAILFNDPPPTFQGTVRNIKAPEMVAPVVSRYKFNRDTAQDSTCSRDRGYLMRQKVDALIATGGRFTIAEIMKKSGATESSAYRHVNSMFSEGKITRKKKDGKFEYWRE